MSRINRILIAIPVLFATGLIISFINFRDNSTAPANSLLFALYINYASFSRRAGQAGMVGSLLWLAGVLAVVFGYTLDYGVAIFGWIIIAGVLLGAGFFWLSFNSYAGEEADYRTP